MSENQNAKYINGLYKLAKPSSHMLVDLRRKHHMSKKVSRQTFSKVRKTCGQNEEKLSFKPMCIFDKESLQDQYRPYLSQIDATDYEISNN